jgi:hypothetical protein
VTKRAIERSREGIENRSDVSRARETARWGRDLGERRRTESCDQFPQTWLVLPSPSPSDGEIGSRGQFTVGFIRDQFPHGAQTPDERRRIRESKEITSSFLSDDTLLSLC